MAVMNVARFERFFRVAAGLDVDKEDLRRYDEFVHRKVYDLLLRAQATAKANGRDVIRPFDLPITKGLQECMHAFKALDQQIELRPILESLAALPQLDLGYEDATAARLPDVIGGLSVALGRSCKILHPQLKNPQTGDWESVFRLFDLLL